MKDEHEKSIFIFKWKASVGPDIYVKGMSSLPSESKTRTWVESKKE